MFSKQCVTHHFACDCREEKFKQLELENAALREDKERLDWMSKQSRIDYSTGYWRNTYGKTLRSAIDAARNGSDHSGDINEMMQVGKEAQP